MSQPWAGKTVLIVDDSPTVRTYLTGMYEKLGFTVSGIASNGIEALREFEKKRPDLVSLDIVMPEMNGIECLFNLKDRDPSVTFVLVSVLAGDAGTIKQFAEVIPAYCFISKPATREKLEASLIQVFAANTAAKVTDKIAS